MNNWVRTGLWLLAILVVGLPVSFVVTFLLAPLWRWIKATYGIESIGHSGRVDWCFSTVLGVYLVAAGTVFWLFRRR